jgi:3-polyprenyl-4-hydroxybenzoate decarboxylase
MKLNLLVGLSGSVACIKLIDLLEILVKEEKFNIMLILTKNAFYFIETY